MSIFACCAPFCAQKEPLSDERIQMAFGPINELDQAVSDHSIKTRLNTANLILVRCWDYIESYCELYEG